MKLSELIDELEQLKHDHGDVKVMLDRTTIGDELRVEYDSNLSTDGGVVMIGLGGRYGRGG